MHNALLVVAKRPMPGQTKTRLCPPLVDAQAAELYECFLRDTLEIMRSVPGVARTICYLPKDAQGYFRTLAPDIGLMQQRGESLGERLDNLLTEALASGAAKAVVMDSDSPTLPADCLVQAFERLDTADVVLGPTQDGGYYLIGMRKPHPNLLRQVQMSTPSVLADTLSLAEKNSVSVSLLPTWYDIDTIDDLVRLREEMFTNKIESGVHTRRWLKDHPWQRG
jgi:rSAM/selenodomain-associated transferase 1